ncbi:MAG: M16 family metallopeptidase [Planctomycetota bacterium]
MSEQFFVRELPNGMALLGQHMDDVRSVAMTLALPAGAAYDPIGAEGAAAIASEWCVKGAGNRDTRQINEALDALGCQHNEHVRSQHLTLTAAVLDRNLPDLLPIYADIVRRPRLADETFEVCRDLTLQDLAGLEDEPARKCGLMLRERFYPWPLGRCIYGQSESLQAMTPEQAREHVRRTFGPRGAVLSVAGHIDEQQICELAEQAFGDWQGTQSAEVETRPAEGGTIHIHKPSAQTHLSLAFPAPTLRDGAYYPARVAETVLSGGMSSRLFTEVREKRGLAYHVSCRYHSLRSCAGMFTYAGTKPELAQETFDVTVGEIRRLAEGVDADELERAKTQLKSALVLQGQSTMSRSVSLTADWYHLGRLRSLQEIHDAVEAVQADEVTDYLRDWPERDCTVLVIGPEPVETGATME